MDTTTLTASPLATSAPAGDVTPAGRTLGQYLRVERELRQMTLSELSQATRIPLRTLQALEDDRSHELPSEVFVKGFLRAYAKAIGVPEIEVLTRFADQGRPSQDPSRTLVANIAPPERGRRFGIAIALVILVILFTLALSIVLRPRHHDAPVRLSSAPAPALTVTG
jgi:cytoskeletal protein RodZ